MQRTATAAVLATSLLVAVSAKTPAMDINPIVYRTYDEGTVVESDYVNAYYSTDFDVRGRLHLTNFDLMIDYNDETERYLAHYLGAELNSHLNFTI